MSSDIAIRVENLSKCYRIYDRPEDRLKQSIVPRLQRFVGKTSRTYFREFWALKDVCFQVKRGESVGIIGRNGAGKSTLLQIITGVLAPTSGNVDVYGRVAALLELGSGFNPEFTGRENVYMNASILGLSHPEIDSKYQDIAEFADIGGFIDQPVKTYSSGMMMRLAFAVHASIEPEVLIVDEAMAVGDARFQLKCTRRLDELKARGTTLLFVSHALEQVRSLCSRGLLLDRGSQLFWGDAKDACGRYFKLMFPEEVTASEQDHRTSSKDDEAAESGGPVAPKECVLHLQPEEVECETFGAGGAWIDWLRIFGLQPPNVFHGGEKIRVQCKYSWNSESVQEQRRTKSLKDDITFSFALANRKGEYIFGCNGFDFGMPIPCSTGNSAVVELSFEMPYLKSGEYFTTVAIALGSMENHEQQKWYDYCVELQCVSGKKNVYGVMHLDYEMKRTGTINAYNS
jgi:lipopolysaccharide transport system ATP-binding protein